jgi:hypothetical protein
MKENSFFFEGILIYLFLCIVIFPEGHCIPFSVTDYMANYTWFKAKTVLLTKSLDSMTKEIVGDYYAETEREWIHIFMLISFFLKKSGRGPMFLKLLGNIAFTNVTSS